MSVVTLFDGTVPATDGTPGAVVYTDWVEVPESTNYMIEGSIGGIQFSLDGARPFAINSQPKSVTPVTLPPETVPAFQVSGFPVKYMRMSSTSTAPWVTKVIVLALGA